ncbi:hypothetical protein [Klebsiella spallanzanii]|uniref:hypothetical protein n=1 Tax=Klebsiella spallanzanii TaxID=2587528 RepID=UPI00115B273C|nr:hypothetical protein [Klebsiella spallanzanii]
MKVIDKQVKKCVFLVKIFHFCPVLAVFALCSLEKKLKRKSFFDPSPDVRSDTRFMLRPSPFSAEIAPQEIDVNRLKLHHSADKNGRFSLIKPAVWLN